VPKTLHSICSLKGSKPKALRSFSLVRSLTSRITRCKSTVHLVNSRWHIKSLDIVLRASGF